MNNATEDKYGDLLQHDIDVAGRKLQRLKDIQYLREIGRQDTVKIDGKMMIDVMRLLEEGWLENDNDGYHITEAGFDMLGIYPPPPALDAPPPAPARSEQETT